MIMFIFLNESLGGDLAQMIVISYRILDTV